MSADPQAHSSAVAAGIVMAVIGWSGIVWLVTSQFPTVPFRWLFYALLHIALTGTALPFIRFVYARFARDGGAYVPSGTLIRQAMWFGVLGSAAAWLAIPRLFSLPMIVVVAVGLAVIEGLLRLRETAGWQPKERRDEIRS